MIDERGVWCGDSLEVDLGDLVTGAPKSSWAVEKQPPAELLGPHPSGGTGIEMVSAAWRQWLSMFSRYADRGDQFDLWFSDVALRVQRVADLLRPLGLSGAIFHTGVSHHIETMLLQQALALASVPQVHLYSVVISGRLLPMVQMRSLSDRRPLGAHVSNYTADVDIKHFGEVGASVPNFGVDAKAGVARRAKLALRLAGRAAVASGSELSGGEAIRLSRQGTYGLETYIRQSRQTTRALKVLKQFESQDAPKFKRWGAHDGLIVMAHYQPEATSYAEAGLASNHIDVVAKIRAAGWSGPVIYREHPAQWAGRRFSRHAGSARTATYYEDLRDLGCTFLSSQVRLDATWLERHRLIPVTMTGSIGIERSLAGRQTLVSGYPWYSGLPGAHRLDAGIIAEFEGLLARSQSIADESASFLRDTLSRTTLANAPGIGTGVMLGTDEWRAFETEMSALISSLPQALRRIELSNERIGLEP